MLRFVALQFELFQFLIVMFQPSSSGETSDSTVIFLGKKLSASRSWLRLRSPCLVMKSNRVRLDEARRG